MLSEQHEMKMTRDETEMNNDMICPSLLRAPLAFAVLYMLLVVGSGGKQHEMKMTRDATEMNNDIICPSLRRATLG